MTDHGSYRPIYDRILHDGDFLGLSPTGKLAFYTLKLALGPSGLGIVGRSLLEGHTGSLPAGDPGSLPEGVVDPLTELAGIGWVKYHALGRGSGLYLVWIVRGLEFEPNFTVRNKNHAESIRKHLVDLPKSPLVNEFCARYGIEPPARHRSHPEGHPAGDPASHPAGDRASLSRSGERRTEIGEPRTEKDPIPQRSSKTRARAQDGGNVDNPPPPGEERGVRNGRKETLDEMLERIRKNPPGAPPEELEADPRAEKARYTWLGENGRWEKVERAIRLLWGPPDAREQMLHMAATVPKDRRERVYASATDTLQKAHSERDTAIARKDLIAAIKGATAGGTP